MTEPTLSFVAEKTDMPSTIIDEKTQFNVIRAVFGCPNGVIRMSDAVPGLVETSTILLVFIAIVIILYAQCLLRSSVDSAKDALADKMASVFELSGAEVVIYWWISRMETKSIHHLFLTVMKDVYKKKYGKTPEVKAIHAGLECGLLGGVYPNWDMISFGPTIRFPHSPDEKVNIETVNKFWDYLVEVLKAVPVK